MQRIEFIEAVHRLYVKTEELLDQLEQRNVWSLKETREYYFDGTGLGWKPQNTVDYWMTLCLIETPLRQIEEYSYLDKMLSRSDLLRDSVDKMIGDQWESYRFTTTELIRNMLAKLLESPSSDLQADIGKLYDKLLTFFKQGIVNRRILVYLDNVGFESPRLELEKGLTIRNLSIEDKVNLVNSDKYFEETYRLSDLTHEPRSLIEYCFAHKRDVVSDSERDSVNVKLREFRERTNMNELLHAIRLCSPSTVAHSQLLLYCETNPFGSSVIREGEHHPHYNTPQSTIDLTREKYLSTCYAVLSQRSAKTTGEQIALRRLEQHGRRRSPEDQIIDLFIGIEALMFGAVLAKEKQPDLSEKTFKLCLYVSNYIGEDREERLTIFKSLKNHYYLRSGVIHGRTPEVKQEHIDSIREMYQRILFKWLETGRKEVSQSVLQFGQPVR